MYFRINVNKFLSGTVGRPMLNFIWNIDIYQLSLLKYLMKNWISQ